MYALGACVSKKDLIPVLALFMRWKEQHGASLWSLIPTKREEKKRQMETSPALPLALGSAGPSVFSGHNKWVHHHWK